MAKAKKTDTDETLPADDPPKKRGRPKGYPKTGGRKAITTKAELRDHILSEIAKCDELFEIARRKQIRLSGPSGKTFLGYPSVDQQLRAWELLFKKALPDLQATQITGVDEGPLQVERTDASPRELARGVLSILREAHVTGEPEVPEGGYAETIIRNSAPVRAEGAGDVSDQQSGCSTTSPVPAFNPGAAWDDPADTPVEHVGETFTEGERLMLDCGIEIEFIQVNGEGTQRWAVLHPQDSQVVRRVWGRKRAEALAEELAATGTITAGGASS